MDERTEDWEAFWHGESLLAYVEQRNIEHGSATWTLDVVRERNIAPLLHHGGNARGEVPSLATAQIELSLDGVVPEDVDAMIEATWHRISLGREDPYSVSLYRDLDAAQAIDTRMRIAPPLEPQMRSQLEALVSLDDVEEAQQADMESILQLPTAEIVAVYDVGQGNCNALCDSRGMPLFYYDFGGGCLGNAKTYPRPLRFCFTVATDILLSHWDFDHWFSALKVPPPPQVKWLAPRQSIGPRTLKFASTLSSAGRLKLWPASQSALSVAGALELVRCTGKPSVKNDSGIAMFVETSSSQRVLCPADGAFNCIPVPTPFKTPLDGLVATHHGSAHMGRPVPRPSAGARLAFSYGTGNTFKHPAGSRAQYAGEKWTTQLETTGGHIALGGTHRAVPCGGGACDLSTTQS